MGRREAIGLILVTAIAAMLKLAVGATEAVAAQLGSPDVLPAPTPPAPAPDPRPLAPDLRPPDPDPQPPTPQLPPFNAAEVGVAFARAPSLVREIIARNFRRDAWENMAGIGELESGWNANAHNKGTSAVPEDSRGWWQINIGPRANTDMANLDLFDPQVNARAARIIFDRQGYRAWWNAATRLGLI